MKKQLMMNLVANWMQVLVGLTLHWLGAGVWFILLPMQVIVHQLNVRTAASVRRLTILCLHHIVAAVLANMVAYNLYYLRIGHDMESLQVGRLGMWGGVVILSVMSAVSIRRRCLQERNGEK